MAKTMQIKGITFTVESETEAYYIVSTPGIVVKSTGRRKQFKVMK